MCEGGTRERKCSVKRHNAISSKQVVSCPCFSRHFIFQMIKQPNSDTSIRFSPLHIINQIREMNTNKINIYNPPGFCSVCFPYSSPLIVPLILRLSPQNFLHRLIYYLPPPPFSCVFFAFPPIAVCLTELWSRLNQFKEKPTHCGSCLFSVYINESFMCWVYGGTRRWCLRGGWLPAVRSHATLSGLTRWSSHATLSGSLSFTSPPDARYTE